MSATKVDVTRVDNGKIETVVVAAIQSVSVVPATQGDPQQGQQGTPERGQINWRNGAAVLMTVETRSAISSSIG